MSMNPGSIVPLKWINGTLQILDQLKLPLTESWISCSTAVQVAATIKDMNVRGAPAIGVAAAFGCVLGIQEYITARETFTLPSLRDHFAGVKELLAATRPTAVNLFWALKRMETVVLSLESSDKDHIISLLEKEAVEICREDEEFCREIGRYGLKYIPENASIITHCNAGALATAAYGTALGVIRAAHEARRVKVVFCDETRPYLQGARLTTWELHKDAIPCLLICDNMAGSLMARGKVSLVVTGADRIAANGDVANKIGTYQLAVLCKYHNIPFYVAAPVSTFDLSIPTGEDIPIENRSTDEVTRIGETIIAPEGVNALHPAFDVTPAKLITAIITNKGVIENPDSQNVSEMVS